MLTNKQKKYLKKEANSLVSLFQIGKDGLTHNILDNINKALEAHELIKINVLKTSPNLKNELILDVIANCKCELVQAIGNTLIFYRKGKKNIYDLPK